MNTLGYSRRFHFWCTTCEDAEHTYEGLIRSFEWFDGVAAEVLVDNQKCAVLAHPRTGATFNPRFVDVAERYGFVPRACRPARARTKGKDERMVGDVKHHFFVRDRAFDSWDHLTQQAEQWLREEADPRVHGTVHEVVAPTTPRSPDEVSLSRLNSAASPREDPSISSSTARDCRLVGEGEWAAVKHDGPRPPRLEEAASCC